MALVEGEHSGFVVALSQHEDRRIGQSYVQVPILRHDLARSRDVARIKNVETVGSAPNVLEKRELRRDAEMSFQ